MTRLILSDDDDNLITHHNHAHNHEPSPPHLYPTHHNQMIPTQDYYDDDAECNVTVATTQPHRKTHNSKFSNLWRYFSLKGVFNLLGQSIATCPQAYLIISCMIAMLSFGMYFMVLKDQIRDGYTPTNAPSKRETEIMREFWNSSGDPLMTVVMITALDGGSMLRPEYFDETVSFQHFITENFSFIDKRNDVVRYSELCSPYCASNVILDLFKEGADRQAARLSAGKPLDESVKLTYPTAYVDGFPIHLERSFFGITMKDYPSNASTTTTTPSNLTHIQASSNLESVNVIMMIFRGDRTSARKGEHLAQWELELYDFIQFTYKSDIISVEIIGTEILDAEMIKDGQRLTPFFAAGFGLMFVFVMASVIGSAILFDELDIGKVLVGAGAVVSPILAISTTFGIVSLLGFRINSFVLVSPFLICGIGVDDAFLMIHVWQKLAPHGYDITTRMGLVFEEIGPSITITSLTNVISFGIGSFTPTPEIRLFCMTTAIAMAVDYIMELIFFGPILTIASKCEHVKSSKSRDVFASGWRKTVITASKKTLQVYCKIISKPVFTCILTVATLAYWYFAIYGALTIHTRLDSQKILPKDSPIQNANHILNDIIWAEYHPVTILINKPPNLTNVEEFSQFWELVDEFESMDSCRGNQSTLLWLRDYQKYYNSSDILEGFFSLLGYDSGSETTGPPSPTGIDNAKLEMFFESPFYKHWKGFVHLKSNETKNEHYISSFWFSVAYHNTSLWDTRIDLMIKWREIASRYPQFNVTVWEANAMFVDQMLSLKTVAMQTGLLTLVCMAVVCAVFIPNPCSLITAAIAIASISLGVFGFLSWWHFDLDPVTMAALLMSIGLSVDFTAHVAYHYQLTNKKEIHHGRVVKIPLKGPEEKLYHTLESVGWPMLQAGASTIVCVLPLLGLKSYAPEVFVKTIFLVVAWGVTHGILVLPGFLCALPDFLTSANCYRTFLSTSSQRSCRYVGDQSTTSPEIIRAEQIINGKTSEMRDLLGIVS